MTQSSTPRLVVLCLLIFARPLLAGLGTPVDPAQLLQQLYGPPCDCRGGTVRAPPDGFSTSVDCGVKNAYLSRQPSTSGGYTQQWKCVFKPALVKSGDPCPLDCVHTDQMNVQCYAQYSRCKKTDGTMAFTARVDKKYSGSFGGDGGLPKVVGHSKYAAASCNVEVGKIACWPE